MTEEQDETVEVQKAPTKAKRKRSTDQNQTTPNMGTRETEQGENGNTLSQEIEYVKAGTTHKLPNGATIINH